MIFNADNITKIYARFVVITDQLFNSNKLYKIVKKNKCLKSSSED